ncbi:MAG: ABC transporter substrate-binding protein [Rhodoferax sp.]|nr:ABC transporter substrate-binding protein [Rhodoferax sp.]
MNKKLESKLVAVTLGTLGLLATSAHAQERTLYIGMNGGTMEKIYVEKVFPDFEKANNAKVVVVPGGSADILAKAQASKDNPQMHVMFLDDLYMIRAVKMGLCEKMKAPEIAELFPNTRFKDDMAAGLNTGFVGIGYNKKMFDANKWAAPTSWHDFADPKYKGKVVFQSPPASSFGLYGFLMINRIQGGNESNFDPGFKVWGEKFGGNVLEYVPSSAKISEMVQTGEAAIFPLTPTGVAAQKSKGIPVEYANPKEGSALLLTAECVIANNKQPELAQKLAAYLISAKAQEAALKFGDMFPTNSKTKSDGTAADVITNVNGWMKSAITVDWDLVNANRSTLNERWNKQVERK